MPRIGSLCSGYGGLDMAVQNVLGGSVAWFFEYDKAPSKVLAHHWPAVPNYGDLTTADWAGIEQVDVMCGGTPCQDLSGAGKRKGMSEGTRSNLWVAMREGIAIQRPRLVVWENVRGAYSARADSEVESEPGLLGKFDDKRPALRALGRVLGDLSSLGYDAKWVAVRASDVGAPHERFRVFVVAHPEGNPWRIGDGADVPVGRGTGRFGSTAGADDPTDTEQSRGKAWVAASRQEAGRRAPTVDHRPIGAPVSHSGGVGSSEGVESSERSTEGVVGSGVVDERASYGEGTVWGDWEAAVRQWERESGVLAPPPTIPTGRDRRHRANPAFGEWMMGVPIGHITDPAIGLTWQEQWTAVGNGVVPLQAERAIEHMLLSA